MMTNKKRENILAKIRKIHLICCQNWGDVEPKESWNNSNTYLKEQLYNVKKYFSLIEEKNNLDIIKDITIDFFNVFSKDEALFSITDLENSANSIIRFDVSKINLDIYYHIFTFYYYICKLLEIIKYRDTRDYSINLISHINKLRAYFYKKAKTDKKIIETLDRNKNYFLPLARELDIQLIDSDNTDLCDLSANEEVKQENEKHVINHTWLDAQDKHVGINKHIIDACIVANSLIRKYRYKFPKEIDLMNKIRAQIIPILSGTIDNFSENINLEKFASDIKEHISSNNTIITKVSADFAVPFEIFDFYLIVCNLLECIDSNRGNILEIKNRYLYILISYIDSLLTYFYNIVKKNINNEDIQKLNDKLKLFRVWRNKFNFKKNKVEEESDIMEVKVPDSYCKAIIVDEIEPHAQDGLFSRLKNILMFLLSIPIQLYNFIYSFFIKTDDVRKTSVSNVTTQNYFSYENTSNFVDINNNNTNNDTINRFCSKSDYLN